MNFPLCASVSSAVEASGSVNGSERSDAGEAFSTEQSNPLLEMTVISNHFQEHQEREQMVRNPKNAVL